VRISIDLADEALDSAEIGGVHRLHQGLRRRDIYVRQSKHWGDTRALLLQGEEWTAARPNVSTLDPAPRGAAVRETVARGPRLVPHPRQRCAVCGTEDVAHTAEGRPFAVHLRTRRHLDSLARRRAGSGP